MHTIIASSFQKILFFFFFYNAPLVGAVFMEISDVEHKTEMHFEQNNNYFQYFTDGHVQQKLIVLINVQKI